MASATVSFKPTTADSYRGLGIAWILMWAALALHVADEAINGFLYIYNPTVLALRDKFGWWPMPTFSFELWLAGLTAGIGILVALTAFAFRNAAWLRPVIYFCAIVLCIANACGHTLATIFGQTVNTVHFSRPAPGFVSSPILLFAGVYALVQLRRTRQGLSS
jgi:SNF family Na+-dependent transporter